MSLLLTFVRNGWHGIVTLDRRDWGSSSQERRRIDVSEVQDDRLYVQVQTIYFNVAGSKRSAPIGCNVFRSRKTAPKPPIG